MEMKEGGRLDLNPTEPHVSQEHSETINGLVQDGKWK
jgi:hypothetical protein